MNDGWRTHIPIVARTAVPSLIFYAVIRVTLTMFMDRDGVLVLSDADYLVLAAITAFSAVLPRDLMSPSAVMTMLFWYAVSIPSVALHPMVGPLTPEFGLYLVAVLGFFPVAAALGKRMSRPEELSLPKINFNPEWLLYGLAAFVGLWTLYILVASRFNLAFGWEDMYERRLRARLIMPNTSLLGYFNALFLRAGLPFLTLLAVWKRPVFLALSLVGAVVSWGFDGTKMAIGFPLTVLVLFFASKYLSKWFPSVLLICVVVVGGGLGLRGASGGAEAVGVDANVFERVSVVPAFLHAVYFRQFSQEAPKGFAALRLTSSLAEKPAALAYTFESGFYVSTEVSNANTGLVASAYAIGHLWALPVYLAFVVLFFGLVDGYSRGAPEWSHWVFGTAIFYQWANQEGFSSLTSGGMVVMPFLAGVIAAWQDSPQAEPDR